MSKKFKTGWDREKVLAQVKKYNTGKCMTPISGSSKEQVCAYENSTGNRCFIGCFIPDKHLGLGFQGSVIDLLEDYPDLAEFMPLDGLNELSMFQTEHDTLDPQASPEEALKALEEYLGEVTV